MSDEIVRRLFGSKNRNLTTESLKHLHEADEDEEEDDILKDEDDEDTTPDESDIDDSPEDDFEGPEDSPRPRGRGPSFDDDSIGDDFPNGDEEVPEPKTNVSEEDPDAENVNPLDNPYAVKFQLGDDVVLSYANGTKSEMKGTIEGYDKLGFYRIKWADGLTTNGITDIALLDLVSAPAVESKCICGGTKRVREGNNIVCDNCGRPIHEYSDQLVKADKSRPKGKKLIKSMASPVSTSNKPSIEESIKKAFSKNKLREEEDDTDPFSKLYTLQNEFWTRLPEMVSEIEELGYDVLEANSEYIIVLSEDPEGEEHELQIFLGGTSRTMTLDFNRVRRI